MKQWRKTGIAALLGSALLATIGCRAKPEPGTVVMVIESSPNNLDLRIGSDAQSENIGALIFEPLVKKDEHYNLRPWLATSWEWRDATTLVFHIRDGVHFHDGHLLTAEDVAWTIESMHNGAIVTAKGGSFANVIKAEAAGPHTCVLHMKKTDAGVLFNLSDGLSGIVPKGAGKDLGMHPDGTGPFKFVSQVQDKDVVLDRNDKYWGDAPKIQRVRFDIVPDAITRALELQKGSADLESNALPMDTVYALRNDPKVVTVRAPGSILFYINFNVADPLLKDKRVRQAIAYALDKPAIIDSIWRGAAHPANSMLPDGHWALAPEDSIRRYGHDVARAKALLDDAGYRAGPDGVRLRLTLKTSTDDTTRLLAAVVQQQMRDVGIALSLQQNEFATFYADVTHGAFQMYSLRWLGANEDPDIYRYAYATRSFPPKGANRGHFSDARVDALIAAGESEPDESKRRTIYRELQTIVAEEEPAINLWHLDNTIVHSRRLRGVRPRASGSYEFLQDAECTR